MKFKVRIPRLDLLQVLEEQGPTVTENPPSSDAAASDNPSPSVPLGIGIGGGFGVGGGDDDEIGGGWGRRRH